MNIGTKSVLFGVHQFMVHPLFVLLAWLILYRSMPNIKEAFAILTHDLGYFGSPNMDGVEGEEHPERAAAFWRKWFGRFGEDVAVIILGHSRYHAKNHGIELSKLFAPDKLSVALYPKMLYLLLGEMSGEIKEYMSRCTGGKYDGLVKDRNSRLLWLLEVQGHMMLMGVQGANYGPVQEQMGSMSEEERVIMESKITITMTKEEAVLLRAGFTLGEDRLINEYSTTDGHIEFMQTINNIKIALPFIKGTNVYESVVINHKH